MIYNLCNLYLEFIRWTNILCLTLIASFPFSLILVSISILESSISFVSSGDGSLSTFATLRLVLRDRDTDLDRDRERADLDGILVFIRLETTSTKIGDRYETLHKYALNIFHNSFRGTPTFPIDIIFTYLGSYFHLRHN